MWALVVKFISQSPDLREKVSNYHLVAAVNHKCKNPSLLFLPFVFEMLLLYRGIPMFIRQISQFKLIRSALVNFTSDLDGCMKLLNLASWHKNNACSTCLTNGEINTIKKKNNADDKKACWNSTTEFNNLRDLDEYYKDIKNIAKSPFFNYVLLQQFKNKRVKGKFLYSHGIYGFCYLSLLSIAGFNCFK